MANVNPHEVKMKPQHSIDINPVSLYQAGQDTIQDIAQKAQEIFHALKVTQLPMGTAQGLKNAKHCVMKLQESLSLMEKLFKKLRVIYNECQKKGSDVSSHGLTIPYADLTESELFDKNNANLDSQKIQILQKRKLDLEKQLCDKNHELERIIILMTELMRSINSCLSYMN